MQNSAFARFAFVVSRSLLGLVLGAFVTGVLYCLTAAIFLGVESMAFAFGFGAFIGGVFGFGAGCAVSLNFVGATEIAAPIYLVLGVLGGALTLGSVSLIFFDQDPEAEQICQWLLASSWILALWSFALFKAGLRVWRND